MTYTYVEMELSKAAYDEIAAKMREAGYDHVFSDGVIDMHGIGVSCKQPEQFLPTEDGEFNGNSTLLEFDVDADLQKKSDGFPYG